jgi:hypothetical protein
MCRSETCCVSIEIFQEHFGVRFQCACEGVNEDNHHVYSSTAASLLKAKSVSDRPLTRECEIETLKQGTVNYTCQSNLQFWAGAHVNESVRPRYAATLLRAFWRKPYPCSQETPCPPATQVLKAAAPRAGRQSMQGRMEWVANGNKCKAEAKAGGHERNISAIPM